MSAPAPTTHARGVTPMSTPWKKLVVIGERNAANALFQRLAPNPHLTGRIVLDGDPFAFVGLESPTARLLVMLMANPPYHRASARLLFGNADRVVHAGDSSPWGELGRCEPDQLEAIVQELLGATERETLWRVQDCPYLARLDDPAWSGNVWGLGPLHARIAGVRSAP